ncbi:hypothetical protein C1H46_042389 [Malus baccata]|uniref:Uncharacterized protein n=1 Tax=Malus baccata TaxID=106549 RepID=A0A540KCX4_MALBA|nr:hypothetical protein C1H46_042389 [Malus baccata]
MLHFRFGSACSDSATPAGSEPPPSLRTGRTEEIRFSLKKAFRGRPSVYSIRFLKLSTTPASANCLWLLAYGLYFQGRIVAAETESSRSGMDVVLIRDSPH